MMTAGARALWDKGQAVMLACAMLVGSNGCASAPPSQQTPKPTPTAWSTPMGGLQCRIMPLKKTYQKGELITVRVEIKNSSRKVIRVIDFIEADGSPASYWRGMILGFNREPSSYHLRSTDMTRLVALDPGESLLFDQTHNVSGVFRATRSGPLVMRYDTMVIERWVSAEWPGWSFWSGHMESPPVMITVLE